MTEVDHDYVDWFLSHDWVPYDGPPGTVWAVPAGERHSRMVPAAMVCSSCGWRTVDPKVGKPAMAFSSWHCGTILSLKVLDT